MTVLTNAPFRSPGSRAALRIAALVALIIFTAHLVLNPSSDEHAPPTGAIDTTLQSDDGRVPDHDPAPVCPEIAANTAGDCAVSTPPPTWPAPASGEPSWTDSATWELSDRPVVLAASTPHPPSRILLCVIRV